MAWLAHAGGSLAARERGCRGRLAHMSTVPSCIVGGGVGGCCRGSSSSSVSVSCRV